MYICYISEFLSTLLSNYKTIMKITEIYFKRIFLFNYIKCNQRNLY